MARIRTTPSQPPVITQDIIWGLKVEIEYTEGANPTRVGAKYSYMFRQIDANGEEVYRGSRTADFKDLPAGLKADLRSAYTRTLAIAENQGDIEPGLDEDDLAD